MIVVGRSLVRRVQKLINSYRDRLTFLVTILLVLLFEQVEVSRSLFLLHPLCVVLTRHIAFLTAKRLRPVGSIPVVTASLILISLLS